MIDRPPQPRPPTLAWRTGIVVVFGVCGGVSGCVAPTTPTRASAAGQASVGEPAAHRALAPALETAAAFEAFLSDVEARADAQGLLRDSVDELASAPNPSGFWVIARATARAVRVARIQHGTSLAARARAYANDVLGELRRLPTPEAGRPFVAFLESEVAAAAPGIGGAQAALRLLAGGAQRPGFVLADCKFAVLQARLGESDNAREECALLARSYPRRWEVWAAFALVSGAAKAFDEAVRYAEAAVTARPDALPPYALHAEVAVGRAVRDPTVEHCDTARRVLRSLEQALAAAPLHASDRVIWRHAHDALAQSLIRAGG